MKSIIQTDKECFLTRLEADEEYSRGLHEHHIFFGSNRELSEKYGLKVWLQPLRHLAASPMPTPHNNRDIDLMLKRIGQEAFEQKYPELDFVEIFGRDYSDSST